MSTPTDQTPIPPRGSRNAEKVGKKPKRWVPVLIFLVIVFAAAGTLYALKLVNDLNETIEDIYVGEELPPLPKEQLAKEKPLSLLLLGLDRRPATGSRNTDVIMLFTLNPKDGGSATVVSVPRDSYVKVDGWRARKANGFYAAVYGEPDAFAQIKEVYGQFFDVPIDYVTVIDFKTFEDMIDELGGINVYVDQDMRYTDPTDGTDIDLREGRQELSGKQALDFVRYRHSNNGETPESSDFERNARQQVVISAMIDRLKSFDVIFKATGILNAVGENVKTDIPKDQLRSLIRTYAGIDKESIEFIAAQGIWQSPYVYLDEASWDNAKLALKARLGPEPPKPAPSPSPSP